MKRRLGNPWPLLTLAAYIGVIACLVVCQAPTPTAGQIPVIALYTDSNYGDTLTINEMSIHQTADSVEVLVQWNPGEPYQRMEWDNPSPGSRIVRLRPVVRTHLAIPRYTLGIPIDREDSLDAVRKGWTITTSVTHHRDGTRSEDLWAHKSFEW
jgi:hypothetical protein